GHLTTWPAKVYQNEWDLTATFSVPTSGTWYVVFWHNESTSIHIEGSIGSVSQQARGVLFIIIIVVLILGFICITYVCLKRRSNKDKNKQPAHHQVPVQKEEQVILFCQYCGTQRQSADAAFCSKCGKSFSEPDVG
ncbi:MAG: hypothetical protein ACTSR9_13910, partial [Candidatus Thorarchaeota archaeon]